MSEHDVERRFKDLPVEEQRALLASMGEPWRDYEPIHPHGNDWRGIVRRIWAPIAALIGLAVKFGFVVFKFFGIFISVGAYALIGPQVTIGAGTSQMQRNLIAGLMGLKVQS